MIMRNPLSYSIWLIPPEGEIRTALATPIRELAVRWGGPIFMPHISLVGGVTGEKGEYRTKFQTVATLIERIMIRLNGCQQSKEVFRSLYLGVEKTPELMAAHRVGKQIFGTIDEPFEPHLSLFYGHKEPKEKSAAINTIVIPNRTFEVDELLFVQNNEHLMQWHVIERCPIRSAG